MKSEVLEDVRLVSLVLNNKILSSNMDNSEKPEVSVMELVDKLQGSKPQATDRMAKPQGLTKDIEVEPQPIVMDRMATLGVSPEDPHVLTKDLIEEVSNVVSKDIVVDPQDPVADTTAPAEGLTKDLVEEPQSHVEDKMAPHEVVTKDLIIEDPPASTFNTLEAPLDQSTNTLEAPLAPSINTLEAPLAPSVNTLEAPLAPVVDTLEKPLIATLRPQVTVQQGRIEGLGLKTDSGFSYKAFLGVPYAKPPIGNLRFKVLNILIILSSHYCFC